MNGAESPDQVERMYPDYRTVVYQLADNSEGELIVRIVERRDKDRGIRDVEVGVTRRKPLPFENHRLRHRKILDIRLRAVLKHEIPNAFPVLLKRFVVVILRVLLLNKKQRPLIDEPAQVVHVSVSIVADYAFTQPENAGDTEVIMEHCRVVVFRETRIPRLDLLFEKAFFGGEKSSFTVVIYGTSFKYDMAAVVFREERK
jgi:hypothetical protein